MVDIFSETGKPVDLRNASVDTLAEVLDSLEAELSKIREQLHIVARELYRKTDGKRTTIERFVITSHPYVKVERRR